jgi:hypothetical protein
MSARRVAYVNADTTGERARGHARFAQAYDAPVLRRVSYRRRRGGRVEPAIAVRAVKDEPVRADSEEMQQVASGPAAVEVKPLTVDDFLRATNAPAAASGIYASGESHPDENVNEAVALSAAKQSAVVARVDAAPAMSAPEPMERTAPSDLVGAPLVSHDGAAERAARTEEAREEASAAGVRAAGLRAATRQELAEEAMRPTVLPGLYRNGRLVSPPPMKGTREILVHQNWMADDEGLSRIQDDYDLRRMRAMRQLVDFPESASLRVNPELGSDRRCARPWTVRFAADIARAYYARFHEPLQVNSAVRTVAYQLRLRQVNGNAAGIDGDVASPHLTGQALDFGKHGMSAAEIAWMRMYLEPLMRDGKLDVEEEFQQACFHISVYRTYSPGVRQRSYMRREVAQLREPRVAKIAPRADLDQ